MRTRYTREGGQTAIMFALGMTTMFGVIGLVSDVGYVYYRKQNAQAAAQAAAIAASQQAFALGGIQPICNTGVLCYQCPPGGVACPKLTGTATGPQTGMYVCPSSITAPGSNNFEVACLYAKANGYSGTQVTMEGGTTTPREGVTHLTYWATARVSETLPLFFSALLGANSTTFTARSTTAYIPPTGSGCIYVIDPTAAASLSASGNASLTTSCGLWDDSNDPNAVNLNGSNATITGTGPASINIVGGYTCYGGTLSCITPAPNTGAVGAADPLLGLPAPVDPTPGTCNNVTTQAVHNPSGITDLCGFTVNNNSEVDLDPGIYIIKSCSSNGLKVAGNGTLKSLGGVMLYFAGPNCSPQFDANANIQLSSMTSGPYDGVLIFQARDNNSAAQLAGSGAQTYNGIAYFPDAQLNYAGGSSSYTGGVSATMIAKTMQFSGHAGITSAANSPYTSGRSGVMTIE